ncbi:MAG: hypothetical protein JWP05_2255 [Microbacteriaceae bacterium]|nr:hypothetical protein [Microbacteriaceae bacterium]
MRKAIRAVLLVAFGLTMVASVAGCTRPSNQVTVNGRTLLIHASSGASADALGTGVLGTDLDGCVTMGKSVFVVPDGSGLTADGSITVLGKTYEAGARIELGGGVGKTPAGSKCGPGSDYFWVG